MRDELTVVGTTDDGEPIYAATPEGLCPACGDQLFTLPDGQRTCGWCDILVSVEDTPHAH